MDRKDPLIQRHQSYRSAPLFQSHLFVRANLCSQLLQFCQLDLLQMILCSQHQADPVDLLAQVSQPDR